MIWALRNNERVLASPLIKNATCPFCESLLLPRCGHIKIWHWAHKNLEECDSFHEPETEWHLNWKKQFPKEYQEVIIFDKVKHIADIKIKEIVVEFQNSPLSFEDIRERENFYGKIKWVLNGETFAKNLCLFEKNGFYAFKWKWFPKSWLASCRPLYIDMDFMSSLAWEELCKLKDRGDNEPFCLLSKKTIKQRKTELQETILTYRQKVFFIRKFSENGTGWGKLISKEDFVEECMYGYYSN